MLFLFTLVFLSTSCRNNSLQEEGKSILGSIDTQQVENEVFQTKNKKSTMSQNDTVNKGETIKQIKTLSSIIDKELPQYDTIQRIVFGYSTEGSDLTGYFDKEKNIKKILARHAGEYGSLIEHYYFNNGMLVLMHSKNSIYDKPIFESRNIQEAAFIEEHCYFKNEVLLKWTSQYKKIKEAETIALLKDEIKQTDNNKEVIQEGDNYAKQAKELIKYAEEYKSELSN